RESMMSDYNTEDPIIERPVDVIQGQPSRPNRRSKSDHQHQFNHASTLHQQQPRPMPPHQHQPESFLHQQPLEPMPSDQQQFRPIQNQGQYTIPPTNQYSMIDSQPMYQWQQPISNPSYLVEQEQVSFITSNQPICDQENQAWCYEENPLDRVLAAVSAHRLLMPNYPEISIQSDWPGKLQPILPPGYIHQGKEEITQLEALPIPIIPDAQRDHDSPQPEVVPTKDQP